MAVIAAGFLPQRIGKIEPGQRYEVVLDNESRVTIRVITEEGTPVPGYGIAFCSDFHSRDEESAAIQSAEHTHIALSSTGRAACARTDVTGSAILTATAGRHRPVWNTTQLPLFVANMRDLLMLDAPGHYDVIVTQPRACAVRFQGDVVVASRIAPRGVKFASDHESSRARRQAIESLSAAFPGALIACEIPSSKNSVSAAKLYICMRGSGMGVYDTPMVPLDQLKAVTLIDAPASSSAVTGHLALDITNPDGVILSLRAGEMMFKADCKGELVAFDLDGASPYDLPVGEIELVHGPSGIPDGVIESKMLRVVPGETSKISIATNVPLHRGRLLFVTKNDGVPLRGSISYGSVGKMRTRTASSGAGIDGWFAGRKLIYEASF